MEGVELTIAAEPYGSADARAMTVATIAEMNAMYGSVEPFDPVRDVPGHELDPPEGVFLVARLGGRAVGCGGIRRFDERSAEIKRMYTDPSARGQKVARRVLEALERAARTSGYERVVLETGTLQPHAITLYRSMGYTEMDCFPPYEDDPHSICFQKDL